MSGSILRKQVMWEQQDSQQHPAMLSYFSFSIVFLLRHIQHLPRTLVLLMVRFAYKGVYFCQRI